MICVNCSEPIESLYTTYQNGHIKLTDCKNCGSEADKYIEFDNVLIFIDVLLLKPQAYRHIVFNVLSQDVGSEVCAEDTVSSWFKRNRNLSRIRLLMILFEVYLTWAYQEKNYNSGTWRSKYLVFNNVLQSNAFLQYFYFLLKCLVDHLVTYQVVLYFINHWVHWVPNPASNQSKMNLRQYTNHIISLTILLSGGTKLFPILMLIWPYNNLTMTNVISSAADLNLAESLRMVTGCSFLQSFTIFNAVIAARFVVTRLVLILLITRGDVDLALKYAHSEYRTILQNASAFAAAAATHLSSLVLS